MKVVLFVHRFAPFVGGVEVTADVLARGLAQRFGDDVTVITHTQEAAADEDRPYRVLRAPRPVELLRAVADADVVLHNNPCTQFQWAVLVTRRPCVMTLRALITPIGARLSLRDRVKYALKYAVVERSDLLIANSRWAAGTLLGVDDVIPNGFRDATFGPSVEQRTPDSLLFVGRLVASKGVRLLPEVVERLRAERAGVHLTVLGEGDDRGEEAASLQAAIDALGLADAVTLRGAAQADEVAEAMRTHEVLLVPSLSEETFGTVALEGAACGAIPVVSAAGGLPEAAGPGGVATRPGDVDGVAKAVRAILSDHGDRERRRQLGQAHAAQHHEAVMVDRYRALLSEVASGRSTPTRWRELTPALAGLLAHGRWSPRPQQGG